MAPKIRCTNQRRLSGGDRVLTYARRGDELIHIDDPRVEQGRQCTCLCPNKNCKGNLIAKKRDFEGRVQRKYFAHASGVECGGAFESALHWLAKDIIAEECQLWLPAILMPGIEASAPLAIVRQSGVVRFTRVEKEVSLPEGIQPDLICYTKTRRLFVEILVTHKVGRKKAVVIRSLETAAVEISLTKYYREVLELDKQSLRLALLSSNPESWWIYNPRVAEAEASLKRIAELHYQCPAGFGPTATMPQKGYSAPCDRCPCCIGAINARTPWCVGPYRIDSHKDLRDYLAGRRRFPEPAQFYEFRREYQRRQRAAAFDRELAKQQAAEERAEIERGFTDQIPQRLKKERELLTTSMGAHLLFAKPAGTSVLGMAIEQRQEKFLISHGFKVVDGVGWCFVTESETVCAKERSGGEWFLAVESPAGVLRPFGQD